MPRLQHPAFKGVHVDVDESKVAEHVAAGWLDKRRKPAAKSAPTPRKAKRRN